MENKLDMGVKRIALNCTDPIFQQIFNDAAYVMKK